MPGSRKARRSASSGPLPDQRLKKSKPDLLVWKDGEQADFKLGQRVEAYPSNLDMSTNVYDRYYVPRGEQVVDIWPIMGRAGAPQR